jgi:excisionase family DNA binding protein
VRLNYVGAAAHLGLKVSTLRNLVSRKKVPHIRLGGRLVVFDTDELDAWLLDRRVPAGGVPADAAAGGADTR